MLKSSHRYGTICRRAIYCAHDYDEKGEQKRQHENGREMPLDNRGCHCNNKISKRMPVNIYLSVCAPHGMDGRMNRNNF
jgi:hypothetical protein